MLKEGEEEPIKQKKLDQNMIQDLHEFIILFFFRLTIGISRQPIVARLLRTWDARNITKNNQFMGIVLLFVDEDKSVINAFIPASVAETFRPSLSEGSIYTVQDFDVGRCNTHYKITEHPYVIRFLPRTIITTNGDFEKPIVYNKFMLRTVEHLKSIANTNLEFPDVVGQIRMVQGSNLDDSTSTQRLVVRFQINPTETWFLTLWDEAAATFRGHIAQQKTKEAVMIVTTVNPKVFGGEYYLNSTHGTRFYYDKEIEAIQGFIQSLSLGTDLSFRCVDTISGVNKKEELTIKDLHTYVGNPSEKMQEANFICSAVVTEVSPTNGWSYVSCGACSRKLEKYGSDLRCNRCVTPHVTGVLRYRVELNVHDDTDSATFVVFDATMTTLLSKTAANLALESSEEDLSNGVPISLLGLTGKRFCFHIKVSPFNFTRKHRTFTVSSITPLPSNKDAPTMSQSSDNAEQKQAFESGSASSGGKKKKDSRKRSRD